MSLRIFLILFRPLPAGETWRYETGMTPFSPDRKAGAGCRNPGCGPGALEPEGKAGGKQGPAEIPSESLTSMLIVLGGLASSPF